MNLLYENIPKDQRLLLESWRIRVRQIGVNIGRRRCCKKGMISSSCIPRRPTFFTRDEDFYRRELCHSRYILVFLAVEKYEAAAFIRRLLAYTEFNTQAKRMGIVMRLSSAGIFLWQPHAMEETRHTWK